MKSALYVFEGPDGVGKSTLARHLNNHLNKIGHVSEILSFPGHEPGTLGEHIYRLYHNPRSFGIDLVSVNSEQLLCTAAHADVIENRILPTLEKGINVVLDRYWWSTWVYATAGGIDPKLRDLLIQMELFMWRDISATCIFLVRRSKSLKSEHHNEKWFELVSLYDIIRRQEGSRSGVTEIDNDGDFQDTFEQVLAIIARDEPEEGPQVI